MIELFGHLMYNPNEHKKEKVKRKIHLVEYKYIRDVANILKYHGIKTKEQISVLKQECQQKIDLYKENATQLVLRFMI